MKPFLFVLTFIATGTFACGPFFPATYLGDYDSCFEENINVPEELKLIAREYDLIGRERYPRGYYSTTEADRIDFAEKATRKEGIEFADAYTAFATEARSGNTNAVAPTVPEHLREFILYTEGMLEMKTDPGTTRPKAWETLLELGFSNRLYRTTWVRYMLGNLASSHGQPDEATTQYAACRAASEETKKDLSLGLAHASFKREYLAQTNLAQRIECGVKAVGYYHHSRDSKRTTFCMEHLNQDMGKAARSGIVLNGMASLEAMALFDVGKTDFLQHLEKSPPLKITPRLAWFMYKNGEIEKAADYLDHCPEDDILANWLRFRLARRAGSPDEAVAYLKRWMSKLKRSRRIIYQFGDETSVSPKSAVHGSLGTLHATQGQMMEALISFTDAGAYQDAALIAERYLETNELKRYVNTFAHRPAYASEETFRAHFRTEVYPKELELRLSYLLARRLFREGRPEEALPYYPPSIAKILNAYLDARAGAENFWNPPNTKAAHLYHAARIMRWKGMKLSGTELHPDYTIVNGNFPRVGFSNEGAIGAVETAPAYSDTAPIPNVRFHYRNVAADLAGEAAKLSWSRHQKAMMLWSAGEWIQNQHPKEADVYYKKLARLHFQPLAKAADQKRWFPKAAPLMDYVYRSEEYIPAETIARAAYEYGTD